MYEEFFGFTKKPFSIVPDPDFFYLSEGHREALAHLIYGIKNEGGFVLLTGDVGAGKTTACRRLLDQLPEECDVAIIYNPILTVEELLATICDEFGIRYPPENRSIKVFIDQINTYLLNEQIKGRKAVLILEEAQNLKPEVLEQIRLLTNLETHEHKLLQIIMIGQPELSTLLAKPQLRQLSQRITARYHLGPLSPQEIPLYVEYRLAAAGLARGHLFLPSALKKMGRLSGGLPRMINVIADRALLGAYVQGKDRVDQKTLINAAKEVSGEASRPKRNFRPWVIPFLGFLFLGALLLGFKYGLFEFRSSTGDLAQSSKKIPEVQPVKTPQENGSLKRPADLNQEVSRRTAYQDLLGKWRLTYNQGSSRSLCEQVQRRGLQCLMGKGSINDLRQLNKPAVLTLIDRVGQYEALLTELRGETAVFSLGGRPRSVDLKEIVQYWSGDYLLLWRVPPGYDRDLMPGKSGPLVGWLEKQLALVEGRPVPSGGGQVYNEDLVNRVKKFQLSMGLIPDGIVGPKTIIPLSALSGDEDPLLSQKGGK